MRKVKVSAVQIKCCNDINKNIENAVQKVKESAKNGANVILLPELFENLYFCQERKYEYYSLAKSVEDNDAIKILTPLSKELGVVILVSFYERDVNVLYNSLAVLDSGKNLGIYRKTHIPDDHYYQEKFYFTPGNTGFKVFESSFGKLGIGICWDQWFPETARCLTLNGAEIIFYPTAIGSEPILNCDSSKHWQRTMQGHSASNVVPVVVANRIGEEKVTPCVENNNQQSSLCFYGTSFITDEFGEVKVQASRDKEEILYQEFDLDEINENRFSWGLFRDRRPDCYKDITK